MKTNTDPEQRTCSTLVLDENLDRESVLLPTPTAARYAGLSIRTLQDLRKNGGGPVYVQLTPRRVAYLLSDLNAWLASRRVKSTSAATVVRLGECA